MNKFLTLIFSIILCFTLSVPCFAVGLLENQVLPEGDINFIETETSSDFEDSLVSFDYSSALEVIHNDLQQAITAILVLCFAFCFFIVFYILKIFFF